MSESASPYESRACPTCGELNDRTSNYCEHCGTDLRTGSEGGWTAGDELGVAATVRVAVEDLTGSLAPPAAVEEHMVAWRTDIGYSHHVNQDAGGAWTWKRADGTAASLLIVADGVSAGRRSEGASKLAVDLIRERVSPHLEQTGSSAEALLQTLIDAAKEANHQVAQRPHHSISSADATTLVAVFCVGGEGGGVWCGDSRVYIVTKHGIERLTRDHSWAEGVVTHGLMSAEDAARDPRAHMITRWLGPPDQEDPGLEAFRFQMAPGDTVLCCSDGLYMYFVPPAGKETEMASVLRARGDLQAAIDQLIDEALRRGGRDNITAAALRAGGASEEGAEPESQSSARADETLRFPFRGD